MAVLGEQAIVSMETEQDSRVQDPEQGEPGPARSTRRQRTGPPDTDSAVPLPLRVAARPHANGNQSFYYWLFATSDLYNWKFHPPPHF